MSGAEQLAQRILATASTPTDVGGGVIPSLAAYTSSSTENLRQLNQAVGDFVRAHNSPASKPENLHAAADQLEGVLMTAVTLGAMQGDIARGLVDDLHDLIESKGA